MTTYTASDVLSLFAPETASWFQASVGTPTAVQVEGWPAIAGGGHALISAPTGTGKTLASFLVFLDRMKAQARAGTLEPGLQLIYISPLKALGNDIRENLRRPLDGIPGPEISVAIRTGDTTQAERRRMIKSPPHILITTPESLFILLTSDGGRRMLQTAKAIILDELHALINTKRGAHMMLSLARLDTLCAAPLQRVGLSATIEPLDEAGAYLAAPAPVQIVAPKMYKRVDIAVQAPLEDMRTLPEGTIWPEIARMVYQQCLSARTVIAFVGGRQQAEKLAHYVNLLGGEGFARTHHGCVSKEQRLEAECQLRSGELRLLCATSSMELGIDVGEVDLVLQLGYPRTISGAMQRLGRAGHNPGRTSVMHLFPRTTGEILLCGLTATVALAGGIEQSNPPRKCLDVLAQHLVSMAAMGEYTIEDVMSLLPRAYNFRDVTREEVTALLEMLAGDYEHEMDHPARPRLLYDRIHGTVRGDAYSRMLALSAGGTIPDQGFFTVRLADGTRLGELDEVFVFEARIGDKFLLGAFAWRVDELRRDSVIVSPTSPEGAQPPFWLGDWSGRSAQTGLAFGALTRGLSEAYAVGRLREALAALQLDDWAVRNAHDFLARQIETTGCLPDDRTILVEHFQDAAGEYQLMVHSIFGGRVNAALAVLTQEVTRRVTGMDVSCFDDDDGFLIFPFGRSVPIPEGLLQQIRPEMARPLLEALLPATPLFNMAFRYNAGRSLMMGVSKGKRQPLWIQRLRGAQVLDGAVNQSGHPLMRETRRECLEDYWDVPALETVLSQIQSGAIAVREVHLRGPSPMALPLRRQAEAFLMYEYSPTPAGVHQAVSKALEAEEITVAPAPEQLARVAERRREPQSEEELHTLLMTEGDLVAGEADVPVAWLELLAYNGRALYIEPGLWICAEQAEQYQQALTLGQEEARLRVLRRCLRYRGPQDAGSAAARYVLAPEEAEALLEALVAQGSAVQDGELFYHADLYSRAQRATVAMRRSQVETLPPERYAAFVTQRLRISASPAEQLRHGLELLVGLPFPPAMWESVLLPARCGGYRPELLDELLAQGEFFWQFVPGEKPLLAFHRQEGIDWDGEPLAAGARLPQEDQILVDSLQRRGASFAQALGGVLSGRAPLEALMPLAELGYVHADSFAPVRAWLDRDKIRSSPSARVRVGARVAASLVGRWELTRPLVEQAMETQLLRAFARSPLLCRETAEGLSWASALEVLRVWEYTGKARRGYFIRGLSGAQFIQEAQYTATVLALGQPRDEILWLNAADPAQPWGKTLPHAPDAAFTNVPGTAVALCAGVPVALLEKQGHTLRVLDFQKLPEALAAFARDYAQRRVFPQLSRIVIKQYPDQARQALEASGFSRQMLDYELWQKRL